MGIEIDQGRIALTDGTTLSYVESGHGPTLVMIPGWSQTAAQVQQQVEALSEHVTVFAVDLRGHGEPSAPEHGHRVARLATDLRELLLARDLRDVILLGHSLGSSVIWAYVDHYGTDRISKLVIVDQARLVTSEPESTDGEKFSFGCLFPDASTLANVMSAVGATDSIDGTKEIIRGMVTSDVDEDALTWVAQMLLTLPREQADDLLWDHCPNDWRDVITSIRIPTLVVGAGASLVSPASRRWLTGEDPQGRIEVFEARDGGAHVMFVEDPERSPRVVLDFLLEE